MVVLQLQLMQTLYLQHYNHLVQLQLVLLQVLKLVYILSEVHFVRVEKQRIILDKYTNTPSYRVGLSVTETLVTPESDAQLLDNATGSSNENAKGAHRLNIH